MLIRQTGEADWQALKAVRLASLSDAPDAFGLTLETARSYTESQWRDRAAGRTVAEYLLAFDNGIPVGMIGNHIDAKQELNLIAMWVAPLARGGPAAGLLVQATKESALARGHLRIVLEVSPDNSRAVRFYQRQGFCFLPEFSTLDSNPSVTLQKMAWCA